MNAERFWRFIGKFQIGGGCWEWQGSRNRQGYGRVVMADGRIAQAHRVSWETFVGPIGDLFVLHRCDNPPCINPDHLFLGTLADNNADRDRKGRQRTPQGSRHGRSRLTEAQVALIRSSTDTHAALSRQFGVSDSAIALIRSGKRWGYA